MAGSRTSAAGRDDRTAPWWAWGFVAAVPLALLALVTPWFDAVPPPEPGVWGSRQHVAYTAWTHALIGVVCPVLLVLMGGQWYGARRGKCRPPAPGDWRGSGRAVTSYVAGTGRVLTGTADRRSAPELPWYPFRTGAWNSIAVAATSLILLGVNRMAFSPTYSVLNTATFEFRHGRLLVHPAIGCWCLLGAVALFLATGVIGVLQPVRPWWSQAEG